ncbi:MAG: hypothetical protein ACFFFG_04250 [Candidatus Thorarchaeota archaeon]
MMEDRRVILANKIQQVMTDVENPLYLSIIDNSGGALFSKSFRDENELDAQHIGFFLSAMIKFCDYLFDNRFNRLKIGHYYLTLIEQENFFYCYVYQGRSYEGRMRLARFSRLLKKFQNVWEALNAYHKTGRILSDSMIAQLDLISAEIFQN